ncbi:MAG: polysaccharide biosynthesis tyrosine autokinase [Thermodesulfobacteriota bacterium]
MIDQDDFPEESEIHLRDYLRVIKKRKAIVLTFAVITIAVVLLATLATTPLYRASAEVLIERNYDTELTGGRGYVPYDPEFYGTQFNIIQSKNVVRRVVEKLQLDSRYRHYFLQPEQTSLFQPIKDGLGAIISALLPAAGEEDGEAGGAAALTPEKLSDAEIITGMIRGGMAAKPINNTKIVVISYLHENPAMAQLVVNNIAEAYMDEMLDIKTHASNYTIEWMTLKAGEEKTKLEGSEKALQQYTRDQDLVTVENKMAIIPQKLREFSSQLSRAQAEARQLQDVYQQISDAGDNLAALEAIPSFTANATLQAMRDDILKAQQHIGELSKKYGPKHPLMIKAVDERDMLVREKKNEIIRIKRTTENDYKLATAKAVNVQALLDLTKNDLLNLKERFIQYDILKREVDTNRVLYDALVSRIKQQSASEQTQTVNIWVVKKADLPMGPAKPRKGRNMMLALILGVFGGVGMAFFVEYLDNTVKSPEEVERRMGVPILGVIPVPAKKDDDAVAIVKNDPKSLLAESYRSMRSQVLLSSAEHPPAAMLVSSVTPQEGKTTTAANFSRILAQADNSVLVIDCDMRKPRLHKVFGVANQEGLSNFLSGAIEAPPIATAIGDNVHLITSGPIPPNPAELLSSRNMVSLLEGARAKYDHVILDSPPVMSVTDGQILSRLVDGTVLVARSGQATWEQLQHGVKMFTDVHAHLLGIVLNGVEKGHADGYYYQGYYSYYGDEQDLKG